MGAYLTGSLIGKHMMVPHISPKKTWEGFVGALVFSSAREPWVCSGSCRSSSPCLNCDARHRPRAVLGFAAVIGDLAESIVKRSTGVKDSGNFLPGIGGALDLVDSLLFTAPLLFFYLRLVMLRRSRARLPNRSMKRKRVVVLGATGSIGESAQKVARDIPERMEIVGLAANTSAREARRTGERAPAASRLHRRRNEAR